MRGSWTLKNFVDGVIGVGAIILVEMVLSVPLYFLGKKFEWVRKNRTKALFVVALLLAVILLVLSNILD